MPLSQAERSRLYRERLKANPDQYEKYLRKEQDRYKRRKQNGELPSISEMSERRKRKQRKEWRKRKQRQREQEKIRNNAEILLKNMSPPSTPENDQLFELPPPRRYSEERRQRWRKHIRKEKAKSDRTIKQLENDITKHKRLAERYRKRIQRMKNKSDSPRSKTMRLLAGQRVNENVKRTLVFHNVLIKNLRDNYKKMKHNRGKRFVLRLVSSNLLKKYKIKSHCLRTIGITLPKKRRSLNANLKMSRARVLQKIRQEVLEFLLREDNSKMAAGKKSTKTNKKQKKQVHILCDTMRNLHLKFRAENDNAKISYSFFCKMKPFFIRKPKLSDRKTCECKRHENVKYKATRLKQLNIISSDDLLKLASTIVCDISSKECMYRECKCCNDKKVPVTSFQNGKMVEWFQWNTKRVEKETNIPGGTKTVSVTLKEREKGTIDTLITEFQSEMDRTCKHLFNITHQYLAVRQLKSKLTNKDILLHIDFSENYTCKYETEIQTMHFGVNQKQISLHTGVIYSSGFTQGFCSISDCLRHGPSAIWAHLEPVIKYATEKRPETKSLFILSDGPTTQYRSKDNFCLLSTIPFDLGFEHVNWSFLEAGHGKGAPDGIGAVIKREADRAVLLGNDIKDAESMFKCLIARTSIKLFVVKEKDMSFYDDKLITKLRPLPGTMKLHQVN